MTYRLISLCRGFFRHQVWQRSVTLVVICVFLATISNFGVFAFQKNRNASLDRSSFIYHSFAPRNQWLRPCPKLQPAFLRLSAMISQYVILGFARYYLSLRTS